MSEAGGGDNPERLDLTEGDREPAQLKAEAAARRHMRHQRGPVAQAQEAGTARDDGVGDAGPAARAEQVGDADGQDGDEILDGELLDAAAAAGIPELSELEMVTAQRDEYLDALQRLQADFDNFRKRVRRQEEESSAYYTASLIERLLPVLDAVELAASHASAESDIAAFNQVAQLLRDTLAKEGLEKIDESGVPFRPEVHDAVAHVPASDDGADGQAEYELPVVEEVLRTGYSLKGKVLRPAMVKVRG